MKFTIGGILVAVLLVGGFFWYQSTQSPADTKPVENPGVSSAEVPEGAHIVLRTENGFEPAELTIKKGETVVFRPTMNELYWPASNLHPSHLVYPEFDPLRPVEPTQDWAFTFDKVGEWKYHDHLAPYFTGVVTVTE
jgi:plastocyanin